MGYSLKSLVPGHPLMGTQDDEFICPQSRFAGLPDLEMEKAQKDGKLNLRWLMEKMLDIQYLNLMIKTTYAFRTS